MDTETSLAVQQWSGCCPIIYQGNASLHNSAFYSRKFRLCQLLVVKSNQVHFMCIALNQSFSLKGLYRPYV